MNGLIASFLVGFKHVKTTIGGLAAIAGGIGLLAPELLKLADGHPPDWVAVKTAWVAIASGVALIFAKDAPSPTAAPVATPKGFGALGLLLVVAVLAGAALFAPRPVRADDPQFGACWTSTCVGPRVAAPALAIDLKTGSVQAGVLPGFGYGFERVTDKIPWGLSVFANVRSTADGEKFAPSLMFDLFRYVHAGVGFQVGGHAYGLLTLGTDLGSASSPTAIPAK